MQQCNVRNHEAQMFSGEAGSLMKQTASQTFALLKVGTYLFNHQLSLVYPYFYLSYFQIRKNFNTRKCERKVKNRRFSNFQAQKDDQFRCFKVVLYIHSISLEKEKLPILH